MVSLVIALLLATTPTVAGGIPLNGSYRGPVCLDPLPAPPEKKARVSRSKWRGRVARGELPEWLVPQRYGRDGRVRPEGRYYGADGKMYTFRQVEQALAYYGSSRREYMAFRGAEDDMAMARGDIDRARPAVGIGPGGIITVTGGGRCKDAEDKLACLITGVNATALARARDRLRSAAQRRELSFIQAVCQYNGGHVFDREERERVAALQQRAGAIRRTLDDPPPTSHWLVSSMFYAALERPVPDDDATWARDVTALSAALAADPDIQGLLAQVLEAEAALGVMTLQDLLDSLSPGAEAP